MAAVHRCNWESDFQWKSRLQFIENWKGYFSESRLAGLSMVWANMKFLGCKYPPKVEELILDLESRAPVSVPVKKTMKKPEPLIENFTIYESADSDACNVNAVSILNESAQKCKKTVSYEELGITPSALFSCAVTIKDQVIAIGEGSGKKEAKKDAAEKALALLRSCQPVVQKRTPQQDSAKSVSKSELVAKAYEEAAKISEDNIGNQMLRRMGWTGVGGIGKDGQGRVNPVMAVGVDRKFGLGSNPTEGAAVNKGSVRETLMKFIAGPEQDIKFSSELSKEDRALIHKLSQQYGLKHRSYGKGEGRFLIVSKD